MARTRPNKPIPVWLYPEEIAALDAHAASLGISRHALMAVCVRRAASIILSIEDLTEAERARTRKPSP